MGIGTSGTNHIFSKCFSAMQCNPFVKMTTRWIPLGGKISGTICYLPRAYLPAFWGMPPKFKEVRFQREVISIELMLSHHRIVICVYGPVVGHPPEGRETGVRFLVRALFSPSVPWFANPRSCLSVLRWLARDVGELLGMPESSVASHSTAVCHARKAAATKRRNRN